MSLIEPRNLARDVRIVLRSGRSEQTYGLDKTSKIVC